MPVAPVVVVDLLDLVLGRRCLECARPGRAWCAECVGLCPRDLAVAPLAGTGLPLVCAARYDGVVREAVIDYKERGNRALAPMLGRLLADAVAVVSDELGVAGVVLVPVPGHRRPARGFDALGGVLAQGLAHARADGTDASAVRALRLVRDGGPIKSLGRARRRTVVHGSMAVGSPAQARRLARAVRGGGTVVVVDDVVTTGATLTEATAALHAAGVRVAGVIAVARA